MKFSKLLHIHRAALREMKKLFDSRETTMLGRDPELATEDSCSEINEGNLSSVTDNAIVMTRLTRQPTRIQEPR